MGYRIKKSKTGGTGFDVWSTFTDSFVVENASKNYIVDWYVEKAKSEAEYEIEEIFAKIKNT